MSSDQSIVYVIRHIDVGGFIDIPYKKIGITGAGNATLTSRLQQISNTKSPIKAQCIAAWKHDDAKAIEGAIHSLLEDSRIEGEWFIDKEDTLVERMQPILELLGAKEIEIEGSEDSYTRRIIKKEDDSKAISNKILLGEISGSLNEPLRTSIRKAGPTLFSDKTNLTYYVNSRKSGNHNLTLGRSKGIFDDICSFLEERDYDIEKNNKGMAKLIGITSNTISEVINLIESEYYDK